MRAFALPLLVAAPLLGVRLMDDDRFDVFYWGSVYASRPSGIIIDQLRLVPFNLTANGNFRPIGRIFERAQDTLVFLVSEGFAVPAHLVLRAWFAASLGLLGVFLVLFVATLTSSDRVLSRPPTRAAVIGPLCLAPLLVAAGMESPVVMFTDIYVQTTALVLAVGMWTARLPLFEARRPRTGEALAAFAIGVGLAAFNELAAIAVPAAVFAVVVRGRLTLGLSWAGLRASVAAVLTSMMLFGFLALALPVRLFLLVHCGRETCYSPSDLIVTSQTPSIVLKRAVSWVPPLAWGEAGVGSSGSAFLPTNAASMALVGLALFLSVRLLRAAAVAPSSPTAGPVVLVAGAASILAGAFLAGSSAYMHHDWWQLGSGWRDTPLLITGGALLLIGLGEFVFRLRGRRGSTVPLILSALLFLALSATIGVNSTWALDQQADPDSRVLNGIAQSLASFDGTETGNTHRCELLGEFLTPHEAGDHDAVRMRAAVDAAAGRTHGLPFCQDDEDD
jgi:hypothetical protein